ncbi:4'-phosphopantetheinyl transferase family protein [Candidatus Colwellia aromaticivorans]|uniref:4'-phosphopantetheinyl transferase family protein n=1 Tax=Candidatus Colwellia aromaticivorans TaxID=2267621 RepID=UPI000DF2D663|nr:4'-phosphopantetheinyl transferase superfamily protein [Candidatus Colwellia aromaticivorans]
MPLIYSAKNTKISLKIKKNEVHLWQVNPDKITQPELLNKYKDLLSDDETKKQQRYKFSHDRHDALITRAFVRDLLSYYAEVAPNDWRFDKGEKDKPEIVNPPLPLRFNLSHTKGLIICAVTLENDIGCDVEDTTRSNDVLAIANRFFSPSETKELFSLPKEQQRHRFFDYWTLKESYIKAWGLGLAIPLKDFSFTIVDELAEKNTSFTIKKAISLSFAQHRVDNANRWRNWLLYPNGNEQHRIAIALRAKENNQDVAYQLRCFNSTPLQGHQEYF